MSRGRISPTIALINEQRKQIAELRRRNADLRWECRSLRVQLYAEQTYRDRYISLHDGRSAERDSGADAGNSSAA